MVYFAMAGVFLFYLAAVPIKFVLLVHIAEKPGFSAGAAVFEGRYAAENARARMHGEKKPPIWLRSKPNLPAGDALPAFLHALRYLLHRMQIEGLHASGRISCGDAACTALVCGSAHMIGGMLVPLVPPNRIRIKLQPDFSAGGSDLCIRGMFCVRAGHIICAALIGAWNYISRRIIHGKASH